VVAPAFGLGIALTRIGCFMNGCCYGASTTHWAVSFPIESAAGMYQREIHATGLYPSQLFESVGGLVIFATVLLIGNRRPFTGFLFYLSGLMYSVLRFCVDFSRFLRYRRADRRIQPQPGRLHDHVRYLRRPHRARIAFQE